MEELWGDADEIGDVPPGHGLDPFELFLGSPDEERVEGGVLDLEEVGKGVLVIPEIHLEPVDTVALALVGPVDQPVVKRC